MHTNKEQPLNQQPPNQPSTPQKGHTDTDEDRSVHKTKEDIREVPQEADEDVEHTSWERPQTEEDKDRVL